MGIEDGVEKRREIYIVDSNTLTVQMVMMNKKCPSGESEYDYTAIGFSTSTTMENLPEEPTYVNFDLVLGFRTKEAVDMLIEQLTEIKEHIPA